MCLRVGFKKKIGGKKNFYAPEAHIMYLTVSSWFLISFVLGGAAWAGRLSSFMHLSGPSKINFEFFGPQMALACRLNAISQGLKTLNFQGSTPSHLPSLWICTHPKHYARGCINHRCINSYYHLKVTKERSGSEVESWSVSQMYGSVSRSAPKCHGSPTMLTTVRYSTGTFLPLFCLACCLLSDCDDV